MGVVSGCAAACARSARRAPTPSTMSSSSSTGCALSSSAAETDLARLRAFSGSGCSSRSRRAGPLRRERVDVHEAFVAARALQRVAARELAVWRSLAAGWHRLAQAWRLRSIPAPPASALRPPCCLLRQRTRRSTLRSSSRALMLALLPCCIFRNCVHTASARRKPPAPYDERDLVPASARNQRR